jgi:hypothetical protein
VEVINATATANVQAAYVRRGKVVKAAGLMVGGWRIGWCGVFLA